MHLIVEKFQIQHRKIKNAIFYSKNTSVKCFNDLCYLQENVYMTTYWLTGKRGYNFTLNLDVCVFVPKKVKLDRVVVKRPGAKKGLYNSNE